MSRFVPGPLDAFTLLAMSAPGAGVPFLPVLRALDTMLTTARVPYAVIGGVAAARAGGFRTTGDIDILTRHDEWASLRADPPNDFEIGPDCAQHRPSGISIDVLFAGDDWGLPFVLPEPNRVRERDDELGVWFITAAELLRIKAAVYLSKLNEYGHATAAKDLADIHAILTIHPDLAAPGGLDGYPDDAAALVRRTAEEIAQKNGSDSGGKGEDRVPPKFIEN